MRPAAQGSGCPLCTSYRVQAVARELVRALLRSLVVVARLDWESPGAVRPQNLKRRKRLPRVKPNSEVKPTGHSRNIYGAKAHIEVFKCLIGHRPILEGMPRFDVLDKVAPDGMPPLAIDIDNDQLGVSIGLCQPNRVPERRVRGPRPVPVAHAVPPDALHILYDSALNVVFRFKPVRHEVDVDSARGAAPRSTPAWRQDFLWPL
jgi:hypothetical protein